MRPGINILNLISHIKTLIIFFYLLILWRNKGIKNLPAAEADRIAGSDPEYSIRDLYNAIGSGNFPSWTLYVQVMPFDQVKATFLCSILIIYIIKLCRRVDFISVE